MHVEQAMQGKKSRENRESFLIVVPSRVAAGKAGAGFLACMKEWGVSLFPINQVSKLFSRSAGSPEFIADKEAKIGQLWLFLVDPAGHGGVPRRRILAIPDRARHRRQKIKGAVQLCGMQRDDSFSVLGVDDGFVVNVNVFAAELARLLARGSGEEQAGEGEHVVGGPLALARNGIGRRRNGFALFDTLDEGLGEGFGEEGAYHGAFSVESDGLGLVGDLLCW
jgi:hypothetical protein